MNATTDSRPTRPSILVVEDFQLLRASVMQWLQMRYPGCLIHGVESAEEALAHIRGSRVDIVLMDIDLPGMSGLEAVSRIKEHSPGTAVVMLTMHDSPVHRLAAANAGAVGYVAKVEMEDHLEAVVDALLRTRSGTL
jgi:two-component system NarL family response regulator